VRIEATVKNIRALLELAAVDGADQATSEARRQGRDALARRVPRRLLDPYQLLLKVGRTPVVVATQRGICLGCHVRLPTMLEYEIQRSPAIHRCPHCRRLLYVPGFLGEGSKLDDGKAPRRAAAVAGSRS
jgi:predicted  nucleic acid-binding Zn-ribbon protein